MNVRKTGLAAITLRDEDELIEVKFTDNNQEIILATKYGQCIRFNETDVRATGRNSMGVRGIKPCRPRRSDWNAACDPGT